jgi:hypothetical protein
MDAETTHPIAMRLSQKCCAQAGNGSYDIFKKIGHQHGRSWPNIHFAIGLHWHAFDVN